MTTRCRYQNSSEIGVFSVLTNSYCIIGVQSTGKSDLFYSVLENDLSQKIPFIETTITKTQVIGSMAIGNSKGLLVPSFISDDEYKILQQSLPEQVKIGKIEGPISALGNCISSNDSIALLHPEFSKENEDIIENILGVEVFKTTIAQNALVGTYSKFNNKGGIVHPATTLEEYEELANLMQIQIGAATVNRGSELLGSGLVVNDWAIYSGYESTSAEIDNFEKIFMVQNTGDLKNY